MKKRKEETYFIWSTFYINSNAWNLKDEKNSSRPAPTVLFCEGWKHSVVLGIFNFGYNITSEQRAKTWLYLSSSFNIIRENYEEFAFHLLDDWAVSLKDAYHRGCCCCFGLPLAYWKDSRTILGSLLRPKLKQFLVQ